MGTDQSPAGAARDRGNRSFQSRINGGIIAAVQWFTEPAAARTLFNKIKTSSGALPRYYQILLKVKFQGGFRFGDNSFVLS